MLKSTHTYKSSTNDSATAIADMQKAIELFQAKGLDIHSLSLYKGTKYVDGKYVNGEFEYTVNITTAPSEYDEDIFA